MSFPGKPRHALGADRAASGAPSPSMGPPSSRHAAATSPILGMRPSVASTAASGSRIVPTSGHAGGRPSSAASTSSRVTAGAPSSSSSRRRRIEDLVLATVPSSRSRRTETDQRKVEESEAYRTDLVAMVESTLNAYEDETIQDEGALIASLRRKLSRHDPDGSQGFAADLERTVSKLKRHPDTSRNLAGMLKIMETLAFQGKATAALPSPEVPRPRSAMLNVPESRGARRSSIDTTDAYSRQREARSRATPTQSPLLPSSDPYVDPLPPPKAKPATQEAVEAKATVQTLESKPTETPPIVLTNDDLNVPKSVLLERWRARNNRSLVPEAELLSDVIYLLQGINGKHVGFEEVIIPASNDLGEEREAEKVVRVKYFGEANRTITTPTKDLIHRIAELGRLHKRIDDFYQGRTQQADAGLIMQSLCHFLSSEMTDYYRLVAILEAQKRQQLGEDGAAGHSSDSPKGLTLRRVAVWTQDVLLRMRLISTIIESCQEAHGGAIVSLIYSYTFHGDPLIRKVTAEILDQVLKPFFHTLSLWIFDGELQDPFNEFFVEANKDLKAAWGPSGEEINSALYVSISQDNVAPPSSLWQNQFRFRSEMLPAFLGEEFGRKIFSTGKSLNFIRFGCKDEEWVTARNAALKETTEQSRNLRYANLPGLERTIDDAYASANTRLLDIFLGKFKLMAHLRALKDYLMLTKGDFAELLMESIGPSLDKPASSLFRHNLTASLETSIRGSNSQYDDVDIVGRLDARIIEFSEGDLGWDSFMLEYRVDEPVSTVLDNHAMLSYQIIFTHLWKMKRVEVALDRGWEHLLLAANMLRRAQPRTLRQRAAMARRTGSATVSDVKQQQPTGDPELVRITHEALGHLSEQIHFVKQMQGFVNLEVIEYSWNDLTQLFNGHSSKRQQLDLDELIASHRSYLSALIAKVMLRGASSTTNNRRGQNDQLAFEVKANLDTMLVFATVIEELAHHIVDHMARADLLPPRSSSPSSLAPKKAMPSSLSSIEKRINAQHTNFKTSTNLIIGKLEKHSNLVVRDLATRLNFNSYYSGAPQSQAGSVAPSVAAKERAGTTSSEQVVAAPP